MSNWVKGAKRMNDAFYAVPIVAFYSLNGFWNDQLSCRPETFCIRLEEEQRVNEAISTKYLSCIIRLKSTNDLP